VGPRIIETEPGVGESVAVVKRKYSEKQTKNHPWLQLGNGK
jgi:hypothetical protein